MPSIGRQMQAVSLLDTLAWVCTMFTRAWCAFKPLPPAGASDVQKLLSAETAAIMSRFDEARDRRMRAIFGKYGKPWGRRGVAWPTEDASEFAADPVTEIEMAATTAKSTNVATLLSLAQRVQSGEVEILNIESFDYAAWSPDARVIEITIRPSPNYDKVMDETLFGTAAARTPKPAEPFGSRDLDID